MIFYFKKARETLSWKTKKSNNNNNNKNPLKHLISKNQWERERERKRGREDERERVTCGGWAMLLFSFQCVKNQYLSKV